MKSDRLLSALILLQGRGRLSTREIAERLEVSQRTAHRDMEALCVAGIPLIAYRGARGGWELQKGWRTKVPSLDGAELLGLLMVQPGRLGDRKMAAAAHRALDKLVASMPATMKQQAESIRARLHIDPAGWHPSAEDDLLMLPVVQNALARDNKLTFTYTRVDGEASTRTVDPLGIVCKQITWYLVAGTPAGVRTFRISRMRDVISLAITFERPKNFDLANYWKRSVAALKTQKQYVFAVFAFSPEAVSSLDRWIPMKSLPSHPVNETLSEHWRIYEVQFESYEQARFVALGLGSQSRVISPNVLRNTVENEINQMSKLIGAR